MTAERLPISSPAAVRSLSSAKDPAGCGLAARPTVCSGAGPDDTYHADAGGCSVAYGCSSQAGASANGSTKTNQDAWCAASRLGGTPTLLLGVFDGHGHQGHSVSRNVATALPNLLDGSPLLPASAHAEALQLALPQCNQQLRRGSSINCELSGCTAVVALLANGRLTVGNLGDSRCLVGRVEAGGATSCVAMSRDHTPEEPDEARRIIRRGGVVRPYMYGEQPVGPLRVWAQGERAPGLSMTRALGDWLAASVGLIDEPEIMARQLAPGDRFLILMSDGISEFMDNEEVVAIVAEAAGLGLAPHEVAARLVREARRRWQQEEGQLVDDCTAMVAYLSVPPARPPAKDANSPSRPGSSHPSGQRLPSSAPPLISRAGSTSIILQRLSSSPASQAAAAAGLERQGLSAPLPRQLLQPPAHTPALQQPYRPPQDGQQARKRAPGSQQGPVAQGMGKAPGSPLGLILSSPLAKLKKKL